MNLRAIIVIVCFCNLFSGTVSYTENIESLFVALQSCNSNTVNTDVEKTDRKTTDTDSNEDPCCCSNTAGSVYVLHAGFSYHPVTVFCTVPVAHVVNHYRTSYLSSVWRPPAVV
ncbi:hypothetical protein [Lacibacter sp. H407]|uniref:hypothetical protein n=1 Tax=Lacibacter sp. H407 TaxID=3133423 RepID=UPI0030BF9C33